MLSLAPCADQEVSQCWLGPFVNSYLPSCTHILHPNMLFVMQQFVLLKIIFTIFSGVSISGSFLFDRNATIWT